MSEFSRFYDLKKNYVFLDLFNVANQCSSNLVIQFTSDKNSEMKTFVKVLANCVSICRQGKERNISIGIAQKCSKQNGKNVMAPVLEIWT